MANWELQLISSVVRSENPPGAWEAVIKEGVHFRTLGSMEAKSLFSTIDAHYRRPNNFGYVPSEQSLAEQFPSLDLPNAVENIHDLCEKIKGNYLKRECEKAVSTWQEDMGDDPFSALTALHDTVGGLQERTTNTKDVTFSKVALEETIDELRRTGDTNGLTGMPWPWSRLNAATQGIQPGDFIMVWALPKSMKTWFGLVIAAKLFQSGRRVLVYSKEMTWAQMRRRITAINAGINYTRLKSASLSTAEQTHLLQSVEELCSPNFPGELIFTDCDRTDGSPGGPAEIRRKMEIYRPHFVLLDSSYMLELPGVNTSANALDWKVLSAINRQIKATAKTTGIPILAILQENERSAYKYSKSRGTASLAMNTGAVMDCDVGIRLVYHKRKQEISIHLAAARETTDEGFTIHALAAENFGFAHDTLYAIGDVMDVEDNSEGGVSGDGFEEPGPPEVNAVIASPLMEQSRGPREPDEIDEDVAMG